MAVVGVLALGSVPANAPQTDRRGPVTSMVPPSTVNDTGSTKTPAGATLLAASGWCSRDTGAVNDHSSRDDGSDDWTDGPAQR